MYLRLQVILSEGRNTRNLHRPRQRKAAVTAGASSSLSDLALMS